MQPGYYWVVAIPTGIDDEIAVGHFDGEKWQVPGFWGGLAPADVEVHSERLEPPNTPQAQS